MNASDTLKTEYARLRANEALQNSTDVLLGVNMRAAAALKTLDIDSVFDLATSRIFANASQLVNAFTDSKHLFARFGAAPRDVLDAELPVRKVEDLPFASVSVLEGVGKEKAELISQALDVATVRDLALWPPYLAAQRILKAAYFPEDSLAFDPEAPPDLIPKSGDYPTERVFYQTLVLDHVEGTPEKDIAEAGPIDIAPTLDETFGFKNLGFGALITTSQSWYAQGVALGQLLHSTALAPGESTRIAMVDWSRRTKTNTSEDISERDDLTNETMHSRSLSEVTKAVAREAQEGFSSAINKSQAQQSGTSSGSATVNADPLNAMTGGLIGDDPGVTTGGTTTSNSTVATEGMTFTSSSGNRNITASTTQNVMDRTQQHANSVRNRRASIVREVSQEEHQSVSTRVVTNYNHMHALSIQYYEVVQIYRVEAAISQVDKCIFIPMKLVDFTQPVVDRYRLVLARAARDPGARDLLTTQYGVVEVMPQTPKISTTGLMTMIANVPLVSLRENLFTAVSELRASGTAERRVRAGQSPALSETANIRPSVVDVLWAKGYDVPQIDYASKILGRSLVREDSDSLFLPDDTVVVGITVRRAAVAKPAVKLRDGGLVRVRDDGATLAQPVQITEADSIVLMSTKPDPQTADLVLQCSYLGVTFPLSIKVRLAGGGEAQEVLRFGPVRANSGLIDHLNAHRLHYSQAIYRSLDTSSLALLLSPYKYKGRPLVQLIDPMPVTIAGNYLVFKMHEEEKQIDEGGEESLTEWGQWLKERGVKRSQVRTELVPLPSGGVFAEAVLGRYNSAEKLDPTRFWNWQDSPIPFAAPEIAPVEVTSRGATDDLKPGQLSAPIVSIVNPTPLPEPSGLAAMLQAIQNGNMFRDMSGLAATLGLAQAGIAAASQGATAAGAQAGANAATAAQLLSDLAKTAASVMTMGAGGAAGGLLSAAGGKAGGGNISTAGALMNHGRSLQDRRGAAGGAAPKLGSNPAGGGTSASAPTGGGGTSGFGSQVEEDLETQAFKQALWGQPGESQGSMLRGISSLMSGDAGGNVGADPSAAAPPGGLLELDYAGAFQWDPAISEAEEIKLLLSGHWWPGTLDFLEVMGSSASVGLSSLQTVLGQIGQHKDKSIKRVNLMTHGGDDVIAMKGRLKPGSIPFDIYHDATAITNMQLERWTIGGVKRDIDFIRNKFAPGAVLVLYACNIGGQKKILEALRDLLHVDVVGFTREIVFCPPPQTVGGSSFARSGTKIGINSSTFSCGADATKDWRDLITHKSAVRVKA